MSGHFLFSSLHQVHIAAKIDIRIWRTDSSKQRRLSVFSRDDQSEDNEPEKPAKYEQVFLRQFDNKINGDRSIHC
jgi:hypothetical protein